VNPTRRPDVAEGFRLAFAKEQYFNKTIRNRFRATPALDARDASGRSAPLG